MAAAVNGRANSRYERVGKIGEGTYGEVYKATDKESGDVVALKKVKLNNGDEGIPSTALREIAILKEMDHPNCVGLLDVESSETFLHLVFEFCDGDLKHYMRTFQGNIPPQRVKEIMYQTMVGCTYMHMHRLIHRDLKPQNILVDKNGVVKLADFGLARAFTVPIQTLTHEVVTLWYRAPEILLGSPHYSVGVDIWSIGCIFPEVVKKEPLFPGNSEIDQLMRTWQICGTPTEETWPGVSTLPDWNNHFPQWKKKDMAAVVPRLDANGIDLLEKMLIFEPNSRISGRDALRHPYFADLDAAWKAKFQVD